MASSTRDIHSALRGAFIIFSLLASLLVAACGKESPEALLASAKAFVAKNDRKSALIQIKNVLQANPDSAEARYLLGTTLLGDGRPADAELELSKAQRLGYPADQIAPVLAMAMVGAGEYQKAVDAFGNITLNDPKGQTNLQTTLANAYLALGNPQAAASAIDRALAADSHNADALMARTREIAARGDWKSALASAEETVKLVPDNSAAWKLKGEILLVAEPKSDAGMADLSKAISLKKDSVGAYFSLISVMMQQGKVEQAKARLVELDKVAPSHPQTRYLDALVALNGNDVKRARELTQGLLKILPNDPNILILAGSTELQAKNTAQAETYLSRALQLSPRNVMAKRMLVVSFMRSGYFDKALEALTKGEGKENIPPELFQLAGEVYLRSGDPKTAEEFFSKSAKRDPSDAKKQTSLALMHMMNGETAPAFVELQSIAASDPGVTADLALIGLYLQRKQFDEAKAAIAAFEKKRPADPLPAALMARTQLEMGNLVAARQNLERALTISPDYFPAIANLVLMDLKDKRPDEARKRTEAYIAKFPKNPSARILLAQVTAAGGASKDEMAKAFGDVINAAPESATPRMLLIDMYQQYGDIPAALKAAQEAVAAIPDNPELVEIRGRLFLRAGDYAQAANSFNRLVALQPDSPAALLRLAEAQRAAQNSDLARQSIRSAIGMKPDFLPAQRALVDLETYAKRYDDAVAAAQSVQRQRPKESIGYILDGDVNEKRQDWDAAVKAYRAGLAAAPNSELAVKLHSALLSMGKSADAARFSDRWTKDHPSDTTYLFHLGDVALLAKNYIAAEKSYATVVQLQPNNAAALNNLAWLAMTQKKDGALSYAEKANQIAPGQAPYLDTLASVLADGKSYVKAIESEQKAILLQPNSSELKLNLAKIYLAMGDKERAKEQLDAVKKIDPGLAARPEVANLLTQ